MIKVGIDTLAMYTSRYALPLSVLAKERGVAHDKYETSLGQRMMSVPPPGEDIVTMAANAALCALNDISLNEIEMLLFATESGIDQSKSAGIYVHELLGLPSRCRVVELKQACYAGTAGIQLALPYLRENPNKKILVIAADIARYGLETSAESSQGAAAIAMILSAHPRILAIESEFGVLTESVMDFWRPNYLHEALVDGKYSSRLYLTMLEKSWQQYKEISGRTMEDHQFFCYHTPVPRLIEKAHQYLLKVNRLNETTESMQDVFTTLEYARQLGNSYTASLYIALTSLLDQCKHDLSNKRIGFYSYGSGCVAEYFSGIVEPGYERALQTNYHQQLLNSRTILTYDEYQRFYQFQYVEDGSQQMIPTYDTGCFRLSKLQQHKRIYEKIISRDEIKPISFEKKTLDESNPSIIKMVAPGKLILSGEHAVVYGNPALAMAINRYVNVTITRDRQLIPETLVELTDLAHHSLLSFDALRSLKERIKRNYHRFIQGENNIRDVLQKPFELAQFALSMIADHFNVSLLKGVKVQVQSDLPMACGMGSSAATILSIIQAVSHYLKKPLSPDALFKTALEVENMQHGYSSGLDLRIAQMGGCLYLHENKIESRNIPTMPMYLVNTGTPLSTTGQCVEKVSKHFQSQQLKDQFKAVTQAIDFALQQHSFPNLCDAISENHRLLSQIGVVPYPVQQFIEAIERASGAAKICGSGAVLGDNAGALLVFSQDENEVNLLSKKFGYSIIPICAEIRGVHAA